MPIRLRKKYYKYVLFENIESALRRDLPCELIGPTDTALGPGEKSLFYEKRNNCCVYLILEHRTTVV